jgi:molecular chaperone Hsp33
MVPVVSPDADILLPFLIDARSIRGRLVRLGPAIDRMLAGHDYPPTVATRVAEAAALAATLAGALKYSGVFTLQIQADGPIPLLVVDITSEGDLRGYARFDDAKLADAEQADDALGPIPRYFGKGFLAFTVDQGADTERYQGIVELIGDSLEDCARAYFEQSEQLETATLLAARPPQGEQGWQAAALMIQRMPLVAHSPILTAEEADENWNRAGILLASTKQSELFDAALPAAGLLHRLYHAEHLELHQPRALRMRCRCSAERVESTIKSFPRAEMEGLKDENGHIVVTCEYCKSSYSFSEGDLDRLYAE